MNRRGFLRAALSGAVVGVIAAPALVEALSTRSIFLPPAGGWLRKDIYKGLIHHNAGVPSFLTNYVDPQMLDLLTQPMHAQEVYFLARKPGERDAELRARMKTAFFVTETNWHG